MFFKWIKFNPKSEQPFTPGCAPSVLVYFIKMMLFGKNEALEGCEAFMYPGQQIVQIAFVISAILCISWMLVGKPLYTMMSRKKQRLVIAANHEIVSSSTELLPEDHEEHPMSEVWTHQAIHTIEFVLGTVSHTASYLRLWALSLAHTRKFVLKKHCNFLILWLHFEPPELSEVIRSFVRKADADSIHSHSICWFCVCFSHFL